MYNQITSVAISPFVRTSIYCVSSGSTIQWFSSLKEARDFSLVLCEYNFYKCYTDPIEIKEYRLER
jgi:hypothetical protein